MNWWEIETILALYTIVAQEWFGCGFEFFKLGTGLLRSMNIFVDNIFVLIDFWSVIFESKLVNKLLMKEEAFDVLVLNVFAFRKNIQNG